MPPIEYYYSAHSAFAYLGAARLTQIAADNSLQIVHKPMDLNAVVAAAHPNGWGRRSKAHGAYYFRREIERWAEYRDVSFKGGIPSNHANSIALANSVLISAILQGHNIDQLSLELLKAHWLDHADLADEKILAALVATAGFDPEPLLLAASTSKTKAVYETNTKEAIERSVFGSPTYFIDGDMFYGQDHLELVERAIKQPFENNWPRV